jgi:tetratricopeptide (TPR) repeat protein
MSGAASDVRVTVDEVHKAIAAGDVPRAIDLAQRAHVQGLEHPSVFNLVAYQLELDGRYDEALALLHRAFELDPADHFILNSIGIIHAKSERPLEALRAFDAALSLDPDMAPAHNGRGLALQAIGDIEGALLAHKRAASLAPDFPDPFGALAALAAERKDWAEARTLAEKALALDPDQPAAAMALATVELEGGDAAAAEARMRRLIANARLAPLHLAGAYNIQADALEKLDQPQEAMAAYIAANQRTRPIQLGALTDAELGVDMAHRLIDYFGKASPDDWRPVPETAPQAGRELGHVFLVGFARSGTTLLEQVLASHSQFVALEEKHTVDDAILEFFPDNASLDRLAALDEAGAQRWRDLYWANVRRFGVEPEGKVFVDKLPLHTVYLPVIAKLFPRARILLARRDPRDVVVSCFRRRFRPNPLVVEFTDLERTAELYASAMRLANIYQQLLALPVHVHRHEDLVEDLDAETKAICDFIGVAWDENMRNFVETANRRDIRTPSANQVRRGLYREGMGQWRRYGATIDPIKPILAPIVEAFGYPRD